MASFPLCELPSVQTGPGLHYKPGRECEAHAGETRKWGVSEPQTSPIFLDRNESMV